MSINWNAKYLAVLWSKLFTKFALFDIYIFGGNHGFPNDLRCCRFDCGCCRKVSHSFAIIYQKELCTASTENYSQCRWLPFCNSSNFLALSLSGFLCVCCWLTAAMCAEELFKCIKHVLFHPNLHPIYFIRKLKCRCTFI